MKTQTKPSRTDAKARRELLLDAANAVFSKYGVTAPLDLIVHYAKVGRATLYRNFPDRAALMEELLVRAVDRIEESVVEEQEGDEHDFQRVLKILAVFVAKSATLSDYWRTLDVDLPVVVRVRERLIALVTPALERAKAAGQCNQALQATDLPLILGMFGACLRGKTEQQRLLFSQRILEMLSEGILIPRAQ